MSVRKNIPYNNGVYFITFTCARWLPLFKMCNAYDVVYNWFNVLKASGHHIIGYVIMPHHVHAIIAFKNTPASINTIIGNGKRFMAYELVAILAKMNKTLLLGEMAQMVNETDKKRNKLHEVFEPSFDWKECRTIAFMQQKLQYMHYNPCKCKPRLAYTPEEYGHSSAKFYLAGEQGIYPVTSFMELQDINLSA
jgi:hypothetical protein